MQRRPSRFRAASFFLVRAPVLPWRVEAAAMSDEVCRDRFRYRPNSACCRVGDVIQFPEVAGGDRHTYRMSAIEATEARSS